MAGNSILTISQITRESLRVLVNNLTFAKGVNRQYDDQFANKGAKIGSTVNIRKPARYIGRSGPTISVEAQTETYVPLTLNEQRGVDLQFTSADLTLSMDDFSTRVLKPAVANVANYIDNKGLQLAKQIYNAVGTPGVTPSTLQTYLDANALLANNACPQDDMRSAIINPIAQSKIVNNLTTVFNPQKTISEQYAEGKMGLAVGLKWSMDQNVYMHTSGAFAGTPLINGATADGASSIVTDGWTGSITGLLKQGDVFTLAGVFAVNPQSRQSTGSLQQFVVTADVNSVGGAATIPISPAITASGQFQNVTAVPADNAALTIFGAASTNSPLNLVHHRDAFVLGSADLELPRGVHEAAREKDPESGLSIRMVSAYDVVNDLFITRLDVLFGWAAMYPELACRVQG